MSTLREEKANGYDDYHAKLAQLKSEGFHKIWILFSGTIRDNGESWCEDCAKAMPVIESGLHHLRGKLQVGEPVKAAYLLVSIERKDWKGLNPFRQDAKLKLTALPAVIYWEGNLEKFRLNEKECCIPDKVYAVFTV